LSLSVTLILRIDDHNSGDLVLCGSRKIIENCNDAHEPVPLLIRQVTMKSHLQAGKSALPGQMDSDSIQVGLPQNVPKVTYGFLPCTPSILLTANVFM